MHTYMHTYIHILQGRKQADAIYANASVRKKIADAFIGQICTANNEKQHFLRKHKA